MSGPRIAPKLAAWLDECDRHGLLWHRPMRSELRALLRAVRAAEKQPHSDDCAAFVGIRPTPRDCNCWKRTLAALDRASGAPSRNARRAK